MKNIWRYLIGLVLGFVGGVILVIALWVVPRLFASEQALACYVPGEGPVAPETEEEAEQRREEQEGVARGQWCAHFTRTPNLLITGGQTTVLVGQTQNQGYEYALPEAYEAEELDVSFDDDGTLNIGHPGGAITLTHESYATTVNVEAERETDLFPVDDGGGEDESDDDGETEEEAEE